MSKHHWMSQKIITVREIIDDTKLTRIVHYITKDRTMAEYDSPKSRGMRKKYEDRNLDKYGQTTTIAGGIERRKKKKKIVGRDRSNTSRVGVGTLEPDKNKTEPKSKSILKQPERLGENEKTKKRGFFSRLFRRRGSQNNRGPERACEKQSDAVNSFLCVNAVITICHESQSRH